MAILSAAYIDCKLLRHQALGVVDNRMSEFPTPEQVALNPTSVASKEKTLWSRVLYSWWIWFGAERAGQRCLFALGGCFGLTFRVCFRVLFRLFVEEGTNGINADMQFHFF